MKNDEVMRRDGVFIACFLAVVLLTIPTAVRLDYGDGNGATGCSS